MFSAFGARNALLKHIGTQRSISSGAVGVDAWQIPKELLGSRTWIIARNDDVSQQLSQRMWFELQKEGVQAAFGTMKTLYPLLVDIEEAASLFRRGGGTSIITIGDSHVSDFGKGIRQYLELGARSSTDFISAQNSNIQKPTISLASVGTDVCLHGLTTWSHLHPQEDLLVKRYSRRPELTVYDNSITSSIGTTIFSAGFTRALCCAYRFDTIFSWVYYLMCGKEEQSAMQFIDQLETATPGSQSSLHDEVMIRNHLLNSNDNTIGIDWSSGILETLSTVAAMGTASDSSKTLSIALPQPWQTVVTYNSILSMSSDILGDVSTVETLKCSPVSTEEEKIKFSLALALYASTNANNSVHERKDSEAVRSAVMQACSEILHKVQSFPRQYLIGGATNTTIAGFNQFAFTHVTSGAIEKLISLEELDSFSLRNSRSNIQTAGAQDEMYLKRKNLLNSDIMYDIVESLRNS